MEILCFLLLLASIVAPIIFAIKHPDWDDDIDAVEEVEAEEETSPLFPVHDDVPEHEEVLFL